MAKRNKRAWHNDFINYTHYIVKHKNYATMPNKFKPNGEIRWVSPSDEEKATWWDKKKKKLNLDSRAEVARYIHPKELKGYKPCQICGRKMSIFYVYPNKNTFKKIDYLFPEKNFILYDKEISEIFNILKKTHNKIIYEKFKEIFKIPSKINEDKKSYLKYILDNCKTKLSPGVMSNAPDRLDGFHTYNICCRSKEDTGRHKSNLARYTQDRRAYENWAEGNWNLANRMMGEYNKYSKLAICSGCKKLKKLTADHIGPISLGFTHRPRFQPLCKECNSKKNNRMSLDDIKVLINHELKGEQVISWHSKYIWDKLKNKVKNEKDALNLSKLMRNNLHHILIVFSIISEKGYNDYLKRFLNPDYSFKDYKFINFDPNKGPGIIEARPINSKNKRKNKERYLRISFEALDDYKKVQNRNTKIWKSEEVDCIVDDLLILIKEKENKKADKLLKLIFKKLAILNAKNF